MMKYNVNFWLRRRYCHLTSHFFNFSVISCTDEIRQLRYLEAANSEEEYNEENDIQSESSRGQAFFPGHPRGRGHRRDSRGRNGHFFRQRFSANHPLLHLTRQVNLESLTRRNGNQSEERQLQQERIQLFFRSLHGLSQSHDHHIGRSHGHDSRRSCNRFRRAPVQSERSHVYSGRTNNYTDRPHHDLSDRPHNQLSVRPHPDLSGRPLHDYSGRPHQNHAVRLQHGHSDRYHLTHTERVLPNNSGIAHPGHTERDNQVQRGRAHDNQSGLAHHNHDGRSHHDHSGRAYHGHARRAHNNQSWRSDNNQSWRDLNQSWRGQNNQSQRGHDNQSRRGHDNQSRRGHDNQSQRGHDNQSQRGHNDQSWRAHNIRSRRDRYHTSLRSSSIQSWMLHERERYHGPRGRNGPRDASPPGSEPEIDRSSAIRERTDYLWVQEHRRNETVELNVALEDGYSSAEESDESFDRLTCRSMLDTLY
ncbi:ovary testis transcribed isoform X1 [Mus musculus]|nr:ovary testis transcribed isoform X1 [Mus musculus]